MDQLVKLFSTNGITIQTSHCACGTPYAREKVCGQHFLAPYTLFPFFCINIILFVFCTWCLDILIFTQASVCKLKILNVSLGYQNMFLEHVLSLGKLQSLAFSITWFPTRFHRQDVRKKGKQPVFQQRQLCINSNQFQNFFYGANLIKWEILGINFCYSSF